MKTIGLVGGLGPESTLDYYKRISGAVYERTGGAAYPELILVNADLVHVANLLEAGEMDRLADYLLGWIQALARAGAEFAAIACNVAHVVFDVVSPQSPIPLVSIVEATCREAARRGLKKPGLMGTAYTMRADFYQRTFARAGMIMPVPPTPEQDLIHERLFTEIELGIIKESTRQELLGVVERMIQRDGIDSVVLGCTELPLILEGDAFGIPFLNTSAIHVEEILARCLG